MSISTTSCLPQRPKRQIAMSPFAVLWIGLAIMASRPFASIGCEAHKLPFLNLIQCFLLLYECFGFAVVIVGLIRILRKWAQQPAAVPSNPHVGRESLLQRLGSGSMRLAMSFTNYLAATLLILLTLEAVYFGNQTFMKTFRPAEYAAEIRAQEQYQQLTDDGLKVINSLDIKSPSPIQGEEALEYLRTRVKPEQFDVLKRFNEKIGDYDLHIDQAGCHVGWIVH